MTANFHEVQGNIRGWLIVIGVVLWIDVFVNPLAFISGLFSPVPLLLTTSYEITLAGYLIDSIANIMMLYLFLKKRRSFVSWALAYQVYSAVVEIVIMVIDIMHGKNFVVELLSLIIPVVIFTYLIRSQRVKMTFVQ